MDNSWTTTSSERDIDEKLVQSVIDNPIETVYDVTRDNYKSYALVLVGIEVLLPKSMPQEAKEAIMRSKDQIELIQ